LLNEDQRLDGDIKSRLVGDEEKSVNMCVDPEKSSEWMTMGERGRSTLYLPSPPLQKEEHG
jgi:hypothetical protein